MIEWSLAASLSYDAALAVVCTTAIKIGAFDERVGAAIMIFGSGITAVGHPIALTIHMPSRVLRTTIDIVCLIAFDALAVRSRKFWPMWMTGTQLATVAMDVTILLIPVEARPYGILRGKFAYVQLLALLLGALSVRRSRTL